MEKISLTWLQYEMLKGASDRNLFKLTEVIFTGKFKSRRKITYHLMGYGSVTANSIKKLLYLGLIQEGSESWHPKLPGCPAAFSLTSEGRRVLMERGGVSKR